MTTRSKDELFQILSNSRRRHIIYYLSEADEPLSLKRLATMIAAAESDTPESEITSEERQRVYISLYQTHLPKLEETGVVTYDEDERLVSLTEGALDQEIFSADARTSSTWLRYYIGLSTASWVLVVVAWLSLPSFALVGWGGVALAVTLGLSIVVVAEYLRAREESARSGYESLVE
jgi:hypothetical protein